MSEVAFSVTFSVAFTVILPVEETLAEPIRASVFASSSFRTTMPPIAILSLSERLKPVGMSSVSGTTCQKSVFVKFSVVRSMSVVAPPI